MSPRIFTSKDGLVAVDLIHCAMDYLSAAELLFGSGPHLYDSASYLAHLGIEMLLKGWLLEVNGSFEGVHLLSNLHGTLLSLER
jgi:HEPN domain-containing protein